MRSSPGRQLRGRSLESGTHIKDDDLALFNEVQTKEQDNFLLQTNDDFEDVFSTRLKYFSDHNNNVSLSTHSRGESSDLLNEEGDKNDYEWLITPPETPLFTSLDDELPQVKVSQRGRQKSQPISISRSTTMEKSYQSSRGSASPNRLSPRGPSPSSRAQSSSSRGTSPSSRAQLSPSRGTSPSCRAQLSPSRGTSPSSRAQLSPSRGTSPSPRAQLSPSRGPLSPSPAKKTHPRSPTPNTNTHTNNNVGPTRVKGTSPIKGYLNSEAPSNLRNVSNIRGVRKSMSPVPSRSFSPRSKSSIASSSNDDVESNSATSALKSISKSPGPTKKGNKTVSSQSLAPKRSFDLALRQMDLRKAPQNRFRPLMSSVPTSTFYSGPTNHSSVTSSSYASTDRVSINTHDTEEVNSVYKSLENQLIVDDLKDELNEDDMNILGQPSTVDFLEKIDNEDSLICSRCGVHFLAIDATEDDLNVCLSCQSLKVGPTFPADLEVGPTFQAELEVGPTFQADLEGPTLEVDPVIPLEVSISEPEENKIEEIIKEGPGQGPGPHLDSESNINNVLLETESKIRSHDVSKYENSKVEEAPKGLGIALLKRSSSGKGHFGLSGSSSSNGHGSFMSTSSSKLQRSTSSKSGASSTNHGLQALVTNSHEEVSHVSGVHVEKEVYAEPQDQPLTLESIEVDPTHMAENYSENSSNITDLNFENLAENSSNSLDKETSETCFTEENSILEAMEVQNESSLLVSVIEDENCHLGPSNLESDVSSVYSRSSVDETRDPPIPVAINDDEQEQEQPAVDELDFSNHVHEEEESTVTLEGQDGKKARSLTLEEVTDTILFCSSIVHNLAYKAADIAIAKENQFIFENSKPQVTILGKSRDPLAKTIAKRSPKPRKTQKNVEKEAKSVENKTKNEEYVEVFNNHTHIVHGKGDNLKPPNLESKCNCTIM